MPGEQFFMAVNHTKFHAFTSHTYQRTAAGDRKAFAAPGVKRQYPRHRPVDIEHLKITVTLDPMVPKKVVGETTITFRPLKNDVKCVTLDAMAFRDVRVRRLDGGDGTELATDVDDTTIRVRFADVLPVGESVTIAVAYACEPVAGLYWVVPDAANPKKPRQIWSQGQDEDNRYWFPCVDVPQERATSEIIATVPAGYIAVANGNWLRDTAKTPEAGGSAGDGGMRTFHYRMDVPHPSYLISLCVGDFAEISETLTLPSGKNVLVQYFGEKGREAELRRSFGQTPAMIRFYSEKIGVDYPYDKYAQVAAADFIFGGMENISATTQSDLTLHDERAHLDFRSEQLVSHELAHQWFGDLLTCMEWPHAWLNEGFATYFDALWTEHEDGEDEFRQEMRDDAAFYFEEDGAHYRRPIVERRYDAPIHLFDRHLYEKGACVLHMLRKILGEAGWWRAVNHYVCTHTAQNVVTEDFARAIREATGFDPTQFFDQWIYGAGHPEFDVSYNFDDATDVAELTVKQTQKIEGDTPLFALPIDVRFTSDTGAEHLETIAVESAEKTFRVRVPFKPATVQFDPDGWMLKTLKFKRPTKMLVAQLNDAKATRRVDACVHLGEIGGPEAVTALAACVIDDAHHWSVNAAAAKALAAINTTDAQRALEKALVVKHPKARRAVVDALGQFRDRAAFDALAEKLRAGDASYFVEAHTARAIAATRQSGAFEAILPALDRPAWRELIRGAALEALGTLDDTRAIDIALRFLPENQSWHLRVAAGACLAGIGKNLDGTARTRIVDALLPLADDAHFLTKIYAIRSLRILGDLRAVPTLQRVAHTAIDGRTKRIAQYAIEAIHAAQKLPTEVKDLQQTVDKLQGENRELKSRLEKIEARLEKPAEMPEADWSHKLTKQFDGLSARFSGLKDIFEKFTGTGGTSGTSSDDKPTTA